MGDAGENGGPSGDLVVVLQVDSHPLFEREGADLYCAVPISMSQAALGCDLLFCFEISYHFYLHYLLVCYFSEIKGIR